MEGKMPRICLLSLVAPVLCLTLLTGSGFSAKLGASSRRPFAGGTLILYSAFPSIQAGAHNVYVWLPKQCGKGHIRCGVLYMQDGQNLFEITEPGMAHQAWGVAEHLQALIDAGRVKPTIIVGIWNTERRGREYLSTLGQNQQSLKQLADDWEGPIISDQYVRFIVHELKPTIDRLYHSDPRPEHTFAMGSSMGGIASLNLMVQYPEVFGGAACLSTHWPLRNPRAFVHYADGNPEVSKDDAEIARYVSGLFFDYIDRHLPSPENHRLYFDHGDQTLDALYAPFQERMNSILLQHGYVEGKSTMSLVFPGENHSEEAWRGRIDQPLLFLLGRQ
jgi:predicted alpha/beta superfamily hydrolase